MTTSSLVSICKNFIFLFLFCFINQAYSSESTSYTGQLGGAQQLYQVTLTGSKRVDFSAGINNLSQSDRVYLKVYNSQGNAVASGQGSDGASSFADTSANLTAGTYTVAISTSSGATGDYQLSASAGDLVFALQDFSDKITNNARTVSIPGVLDVDAIDIFDLNSDVNTSGSLVINLPIVVETGSAGTQPSVNVSYDSNVKSSGIMGAGWSLNAYSSISRCVHDQYTNLSTNRAKSLQWNDDDQFCYNGQQLVLVSGQHKQNGAVYKTAADSFTDFVYNDNSFEVTNKSSDVTVFGGAGYIVEDYLWLQKSTTDVNNNEIRFNYTHISHGVLLDNIKYGRTTSSQFSGQFEVQFSYINKDAKAHNISFLGNEKYLSNEKLLSSISIKHNNEEKRVYDFTYELSNFTYQHKLTEVSRCNLGVCLPPAKITYSEPSQLDIIPEVTQLLSDISQSSINFNTYIKVGDFNGDGISDIFIPNENGWSVQLGGSLPHGAPASIYSYPAGLTTQQLTNLIEAAGVADINGDGKAELIIADNSNTGTYKLVTVTATPSTVAVQCMGQIANSYLTIPNHCSETSNVDYTTSEVLLVDNLSAEVITNYQLFQADEDDSIDILYSANSQTELHLLLAANNYSAAQLIGSMAVNGSNAREHFKLFDYQGDGIPDIVATSSNGYLYAYINDGKANFNQITLYSGASNSPLFVYDYNADGCSEISLLNGSSPQINSCGKLNGASNSTFNPGAEHLVDITFSGIAERLVPQGNNITVYAGSVIANAGSYSLNQKSIGTIGLSFSPATSTSYSTLHSGDFTGDGLIDLLVQQDNTGNWYIIEVAKAYATEPLGVITALSNSVGINEYIDYSTTLDSNIYTDTQPIGQNNTRLALPVVKRITADKAQDKLKTVFKYQGAKVANGHGFVGFEAFERADYSDENLCKVSTTYFHQGFTDSHAPSSSYTGKGLPQSEYSGMPIYEILSVQNKLTGIKHLLSSVENFFGKQVTDSAVDSDVISPFHTYVTSSHSKIFGMLTNANYPEGVGYNYLKTSTESEYQLNSHGNLTYSKITLTGDGDGSAITESYNDYGTDDFSQRFGRLKSSRVTKTTGIPDPKTGGFITSIQNKSSAFEYHTNGRLFAEIVEPGNNLSTRKEYQYDDAGNNTSTIITGQDYEPGVGFQSTITRSSYKTFDNEYRLLTKEGNSDFETSYQYTPQGWIESVSVRNVKNAQAPILTSYFYYDYFGNKIASKGPSGAVSASLSHWCNNNSVCSGIKDANDEDPLLVVEQKSTGKPTQWQFSANDGSVFLTKTETDDASVFIYQRTDFDDVGLAKRQYQPSFNIYGGNVYSDLTYDYKNRIVQVTSFSPNGNLITGSSEFGRFYTKTTNTNNQTKYSYSNILGRVSSTVDFDSVPVYFRYNAYGNLLEVEDSQNNIIYNTYDAMGYRIQMNDPNKGLWQYSYNAFGQLREQTDAKGQKTYISYDHLGRKTRRVENATGVGNSVTQTSCWLYSSSEGKLSEELLFDGDTACSTTATALHKNQFSYDELSRLTESVTTIENKPYTQQVYYDNAGRIAVQQLSHDSAVVNNYSAIGLLQGQRFVNTSGQIDKLLYSVEERNNRGQATKVSGSEFGSYTSQYNAYTGLLDNRSLSNNNGALIYQAQYDYDDLANLTKRYSALDTWGRTAVTETFTYDGLNRITSQQRENIIVESYCYDEIGNMLNKVNGSVSCGTADYLYGNSNKSAGGNAGVHAVRQIGNNTFNYDNNGNLVNDNNRSLLYTAFDKVTSITKNGQSKVEFAYGANHRRYLRKDTDISGNGKANYLTHYVGSYERVKRIGGEQGSTVDEKYTVGNFVITRYGNTGAFSFDFLIKDNINSITAITDKSGQIKKRYIYSPFGEQIELVGNTLLGELTLVGRAAITQRGFTGHEMAASVGIIHMNGRIYDQVIGRFLQADPYIKNPGSPQGLNRYSYVENNPLNLIDPSGYGWLSKAWKKVKKTVKKIGSAIKGVAKKIGRGVSKSFKGIGRFVKRYGRVIAAVAITAVTAGTLGPAMGAWAVSSLGITGATAAGIVGGAVSGAVAGFAGGVVSSGSLKGGLKGALTGAVFGGIGGYGKVTEGFVGSANEVAAHAVGGGAAAKLNGGHALKGAITGGFNKYVGRIVHNSGLQIHEQVAAQAVVGGTSSVISGGKFENGAITAAIQYTVNEVAKSTIGTTKERITKRVFSDGKSVTSERELGKPKWIGIQAAGPLLDKLAKMPSHLTLAVSLEVLVQEYGVYELVEEYDVEYTYKVSRDGTFDYNSEILNIGPEIPIGNPTWMFTGQSTGFSPIDIRGCVFSCDGYGRGVFGNGSN
jgi:RHS repeat-associated protein